MMHAEYNGYLVALSIVIASIAGYVALDLAGRVRQSRARATEADALSDSVDMLRAVIDDSPVAIVATDLELSVTRWNAAAAALFGWRAEEIRGQSYQRIVPPGELTQHEELQSAALKGRSTTHLRTSYRRKDGASVAVNVSLAVLRDRDAVARGFVFLVADESARRMLEMRISQTERLEAVGQLAGGVAHDFNNLLTAITSYSQFLLAGMETGDSRRSDVLGIQEAATRAANLTRQLLAFTRQQVRSPELISLNDMITGVADMLRRLLPENIKLTLELDAGLGSVNADPSQIDQVIMNLLVNARDAMPDGGQISICTENVTVNGRSAGGSSSDVAPGEYVILSVKDTGAGMSPEIQRRMFEPFFTTKPPGIGTGLGLATVYGIVSQNEGHVWVESAPGKGTEFRVYLRRIVQTVLPQAAPALACIVPRGSETILFAEDDALVREVGLRTLREYGYTVLTAANGREALETFERNPRAIDLVVTDLVMPEIGGYELEKRLRSRDPSVRVVFVSGYSKDTLARVSGTASRSVHLAKPFTPEQLATAVRDRLDAPSVTPIEVLHARQQRRRDAEHRAAR